MTIDNIEIKSKTYDLVKSLLTFYKELTSEDPKRYEDLKDKVLNSNLKEKVDFANKYIPDILNGVTYEKAVFIVKIHKSFFLEKKEIYAFKSFVLACDYLVKEIMKCFFIKNKFQDPKISDEYVFDKNIRLKITEYLIDFILVYISSLDIDVAQDKLDPIVSFLDKHCFSISLECVDYLDYDEIFQQNN